MEIVKRIKQIQLLGITADIKIPNGVRHFHHGHEYADLGLPSGTKWATMNVGASSETDYGNYYQYGKDL